MFALYVLYFNHKDGNSKIEEFTLKNVDFSEVTISVCAGSRKLPLTYLFSPQRSVVVFQFVGLGVQSRVQET